MISSGLFTAGQVAGLFSVIASCNGCGKADTSVVTLTSPSASQPVLTSLAIAPGSVSLGANATQQFTVSATWSDGSSTAPSLSWSVVGIGSVNQSGLYTASSNAGSASVIARHLSSGKADTSTVTITSSAPPPPQGQIGSAGPGPNQPAGMTPVFDNPMDVVPPQLPLHDQNGFGVISNGSRLSVVTEGTQTFLRGITPGSMPQIGNSVFNYDSGINFPSNTGLLYTRIRFRLSDNHRSQDASFIKWFAVRFKSPAQPGGNNTFFMFERRTTNGEWGFFLGQQAGGTGPDFGSKNFMMPSSPNIKNGVWYDLEVVFTANTAGVANGSIDIYLNGTLWGRRTGIGYVTAGNSTEWDRMVTFWQYAALSKNPGIANTQDQWIDIDEWYASVR